MSCESAYLQYDFVFNRGVTPEFQLVYAEPDETPIPITGYTVRMTIRKYDNWHDLTALDDSFVAEWLSADGKWEVNEDDGQIILRADIDDVAALSATNEAVVHRYQLEFVIPGSPDQVIPLLEGTVTVIPEVPANA